MERIKLEKAYAVRPGISTVITCSNCFSEVLHGRFEDDELVKDDGQVQRWKERPCLKAFSPVSEYRERTSTEQRRNRFLY